jgi:hypothetical protein
MKDKLHKSLRKSPEVFILLTLYTWFAYRKDFWVAWHWLIRQGQANAIVVLFVLGSVVLTVATRGLRK